MLPCVIALVLAVSLGCAQDAAEHAHTDDAPTAQDEREWMLARVDGADNADDDADDGETLIADVEERLVAEGRIDDVSVEVTTTGGVVTLTGRVADETRKRRLGAVVAEVAGVEHVENQLQISRAPKRHPSPTRQCGEGGPTPCEDPS